MKLKSSKSQGSFGKYFVPPHWISAFYMHWYYQKEQFIKSSAKLYDKENINILDAGSEEKTYSRYFDKGNYRTLDIKQNKAQSIDYILDLNKPLKLIKDNQFDIVLCIQVLEHLKNPSFTFKEFNRILKKKGVLILSTNFIYQIHMAPNDYFRFTKYGLIELGKSNEFTINHIKPQGGIFQTLSYILTTFPIRLFFENHPRAALVYIILLSPIIIALNCIAVVLDIFDKNKLLTPNYEVIYQKI